MMKLSAPFRLLIWVSVLSIWACTSTPDANWPEKDMMEYGVPMKIKAPEGVQVERGKIAFQEDITVRGEGYNLQIFVSDALAKNAEEAIESHKDLVREGTYFDKMIKEEPQGFIFENAIDSTHHSYGFRFVKVMGGREYLFQEGLMGSFDLPEIEAMYRSVQ